MSDRSTGPNSRLSDEIERWSPIMKKLSSGTIISPMERPRQWGDVWDKGLYPLEHTRCQSGPDGREGTETIYTYLSMTYDFTCLARRSGCATTLRIKGKFIAHIVGNLWGLLPKYIGDKVLTLWKH